MSDRKKRYRKPKDEKRHIRVSVQHNDKDMQPKILLKTKMEPKSEVETPSASSCTNTEDVSLQVPEKNIIFPKEPQSRSTSPTTSRETATVNNESTVPNNIEEPVYQMTRPATVISSTGSPNGGAKKLLIKGNTDFFVVGVVGTQGVGKSTILNLLANEKSNYDFFNKVFVEEDSVFPTKIKANKCSSRSRTESTHMFITSDRMILLDTPPVHSNTYNKDMITNELEDLSGIILLMSVCHLLLVVQDDYFNLNFLKLLRFAELMKPSQDVKPFLHDYLPNVMFVKNKAKRLDFASESQATQDKMYEALFKDSKLRIYRGQVTENYLQQQIQQLQNRKKNRHVEVEKKLNSFLIPEIKKPEATTYHEAVDVIVRDFRRLVFMTPRNQMYAGSTDLTEEIWFDWLTKVSQNDHNFFLTTYEEVQRKHLEVSSASERSDDSWRE